MPDDDSTDLYSMSGDELLARLLERLVDRVEDEDLDLYAHLTAWKYVRGVA